MNIQDCELLNSLEDVSESIILFKLNLINWLYSFSVKEKTNILREGLMCACEYGYFEIVKWLIKVENIDIHFDNDLLFRNACENGHIEIAQWLYSLKDASSIRGSAVKGSG